MCELFYSKLFFIYNDLQPNFAFILKWNIFLFFNFKFRHHPWLFVAFYWRPRLWADPLVSHQAEIKMVFCLKNCSDLLWEKVELFLLLILFCEGSPCVVVIHFLLLPSFFLFPSLFVKKNSNSCISTVVLYNYYRMCVFVAIRSSA